MPRNQILLRAGAMCTLLLLVGMLSPFLICGVVSYYILKDQSRKRGDEE